MTKQAPSNRLRVFPLRPFDGTWTAERWGYPIFAQRTGPFEVADPDKTDATTTVDRIHLTGQPGYEIGHIQAVAPGGLPDGLIESEPFTQADKELLARLELGEIVGAVLAPVDPKGLPEWSRLRVYLIELCGVRESSLPYLTWRDVIGLVRRVADENNDDVPALSDIELEVLYVFEYRQVLTKIDVVVEEMKMSPHRKTEKTIKAAVRKLIEIGLVERPTGANGKPGRKGSRITARGQKYLDNIAEKETR